MNKMEKDLESKVYDSWNLLGKEFPSSHCEGEKAKVIMYDHTGYMKAKCNCGEVYVLDQGAYKIKPELNTKEAVELFAEEGG